MKTKGKNLSQLWKRNMVVAAIAVFVCAAVYLNWNYEQEVGKTLGESAMVGKEDPLVSGGGSSAPGSDGSGQTGQSACTYCPYSKVCGFDRRIPGFQKRELEKLEDAEALRRMKDRVAVTIQPEAEL